MPTGNSFWHDNTVTPKCPSDPTCLANAADFNHAKQIVLKYWQSQKFLHYSSILQTFFLDPWSIVEEGDVNRKFIHQLNGTNGLGCTFRKSSNPALILPKELLNLTQKSLNTLLPNSGSQHLTFPSNMFRWQCITKENEVNFFCDVRYLCGHSRYLGL